ncbi:hypothetical protein BGZ63DRAFT_406115 [Mariannaea sp. PMI_226]|nr:hypothetical protein BGZ63DRAFT_406115 [Mariannaea sp. PMI_226]
MPEHKVYASLYFFVLAGLKMYAMVAFYLSSSVLSIHTARQVHLAIWSLSATDITWKIYTTSTKETGFQFVVPVAEPDAVTVPEMVTWKMGRRGLQAINNIEQRPM